MKVVQINVTYKAGSTGRIVSNIHQSLINQGHESHVFYGRGRETNDKNVYKISNIISQAIDGIKTRFLNKHGRSNYFSTKKLIQKINEIQPDVVHLHNLHGYYINYQILFQYLKEAEIPVVWLLHDQWAVSGGAANFNKGDIGDWEKPNKNASKILSDTYPKTIFKSNRQITKNYILKKKLFSKISNMVIVVPSRWLNEEIQETFLSKHKIITIYNGFDLSEFTPTNFRVNHKKIILGVASIWNENKGITYFNRLAEDLSDNEYQIIIVGQLESEKLLVNPNITKIPKTESIEELAHLYSDADVFVNPTLFDNFPSVNVESQACGTPVITFDTGGSAESIISDTGVIIKQGDYQSLLKAVVDQPKKNTTVVKNCVDNAKKYSNEIMIKNYMRLYNELVEGEIV